jgi:PAS domain S-box-containing protein
MSHQPDQRAPDGSPSIDLDTVFDQLPLGLALYDVTPEFRCVRHNGRFLDLVGAPWRVRGSVVGVALRDLFDAASYEATRAIFERVATTGQVFSIEEYAAVLAPDPRPRYYQWSLSPVAGAGGVAALLLSAVEITAHKRAEEQLRDNQRQLELALEAAGMGAWSWNIQTGEVSWSPSLEPLHGFAPGTFGGTYSDFDALVHPEDRRRVDEAVARTLATGEPYRVEFRVVWRDGSVHWIAGRGQVVYDEGGAPLRLFGLGISIDARKQAEEERAILFANERRAREQAEAANDRLAFLTEATTALAASLDYETTLASIVRLALDYFADWCSIYLVDEAGARSWAASLTRDPAKQHYVEELHHDYPPERLPSTLVSRVLTSGEPGLVPVVDEAFMYAVAVDERHVEIFKAIGPSSYMVVPLLLHGATRGVLVLAITGSGRVYDEADLALAQELARRAVVAIEQARLYSAEQRARAEAEQAVRARDVFISVAAHELRTPLTALLGQVQLLQRRAARENHLIPRDQQTIETVAAQARRLDTLVLAMLDVARIEQGQLRLDLATLDLRELARRVVAEVQPTLERHTIGYAAPDAPAPVRGDALRLEQVVQNLLGNAVKYSPGGGQIHLRLELLGDEVAFSVRDEGMGIPAGALPSLFERFFRAENVDNRKISGLGIGLYVVREIVARHGGAIDVQSTEGQGSTFTIRLPLARE